MPKLWTVVGITLATAGMVRAAEEKPAKIDLGGLRKVTADLTASADMYVFKVRMLPVHAFDAATNAELNREKARQYGLQALAKHLGESEVIVSGVQVADPAIDGKFYTLVVRVPRKGVEVVKKVQEPKPQGKDRPEQIAFASSFFTRKQDYLNTLGQLVKKLDVDIKRIEGKQEKAFFLAVADAEEHGTTNLKALSDEIQKDALLLSVEKEELLKAVAPHKDLLLDKLKALVKNYEEKKEKP